MHTHSASCVHFTGFYNTAEPAMTAAQSAESQAVPGTRCHSRRTPLTGPVGSSLS